MVTGASGDGKSSIVYAGLLPNVKAGFVRGKYARWNTAVFKPGNRPLTNMIKSLTTPLSKSEDELHEELKYGYSALIDLFLTSESHVKEEELAGLDEKETKKALKTGRNLLIVVDQFEEFFTNQDNFDKETSSPSNEANGVVNLLIETARIAKTKGIPIYIICTMRSDFIGNAPAYRGLPELIGDYQFFVPRLNRQDIEIAISEPAVLNGNSLNPRLAQRLLTDLDVVNTDLLPSLQHCLRRIWEVAGNGTEELDLIHYAKVGGMKPADLPDADKVAFENWFMEQDATTQSLYTNQNGISNVLNLHANFLFETAHLQDGIKVEKEEVQRIIQIFFRSLTKIDENRAVRNLSPYKEIVSIVDRNNIGADQICKIVNVFRTAGNTLVFPYIESNDQEHLSENDVLDISHEALIRNWKKLRQWTKDEYNDYQDFKETNALIERWVASGKKDEHLMSVGLYNYFTKGHVNLTPTVGWIARYLENRLILSDGGSEQDLLETEELSFEQKITKAEEVRDLMLEFYTESQRKIRQIRTIKRTVTLTLSILVVLLGLAYYFSVQSKKRVQLISDANAIAIKALMLVEEQPIKSREMALESYDMSPNELAKQALYSNHFYCPRMDKLAGYGEGIVRFTDNQFLIISDTAISLFDRKTLKLKKVINNFKISSFHLFGTTSYIVINDKIYYRNSDSRMCIYDSKTDSIKILPIDSVDRFLIYKEELAVSRKHDLRIYDLTTYNLKLTYSNNGSRIKLLAVTHKGYYVVENDRIIRQVSREGKGIIEHQDNSMVMSLFNYHKDSLLFAYRFGPENNRKLIVYDYDLTEIKAKEIRSSGLILLTRMSSDNVIYHEIRGQAFCWYWKRDTTVAITFKDFGTIRRLLPIDSNRLLLVDNNDNLLIKDGQLNNVSRFNTIGFGGPTGVEKLQDSALIIVTRRNIITVNYNDQKLMTLQLGDSREVIGPVQYLPNGNKLFGQQEYIVIQDRNGKLYRYLAKAHGKIVSPILVKNQLYYINNYYLHRLNLDSLTIKSARKWPVNDLVSEILYFDNKVIIKGFSWSASLVLNLENDSISNFETIKKYGKCIVADSKLRVYQRNDSVLFITDSLGLMAAYLSSDIIGVSFIKEHCVVIFQDQLACYSYPDFKLVSKIDLGEAIKFRKSDDKEMLEIKFADQSINFYEIPSLNINRSFGNIDMNDFGNYTVGKDGKIALVTVSSEVRIYDKNNQFINSWYIPKGVVKSMDFSTDSKKLMIGTSNGKVVEYYIDPQQMLEYFK